MSNAETVLIFGELWENGPRVGEVIVNADDRICIALSKSFARKRIGECRRKGAVYPDARVRVIPNADA